MTSTPDKLIDKTYLKDGEKALAKKYAQKYLTALLYYKKLNPSRRQPIVTLSLAGQYSARVRGSGLLGIRLKSMKAEQSGHQV
tara:strand:- start:212 stop:460 length:249 start_codon:yes stop_codon:yes gene_type:complete